MNQSKQAQRSKLKTRRRALTETQALLYSQKIIDSVLAYIDWSKINGLHTYLPLPEQHEVTTWPLLHALWQVHPHVQTATWQESKNSSQSVWIQKDTKPSPVTPNQQFDVIIVPLLGFNDTNHRIGFGGGFYDRFLPTQVGALTIGLGYDFAHVDFKPEAHDIALSCIITDKRLVERS